MKKVFIITPLVSVGDIKIGMNRVKVRENLGNYSEYRNSKEDSNTADCFDICQVFYDKNDCVECIMFHSLDKIKLFWEDVCLTDMTKPDIILFFTKIDKDLFIEDYGYSIISIESNALGFACYFQTDVIFNDDGNETVIDKIESISVAVKDYWK